MARPVIDEWRGSDLTYLSPAQTLNKFGYVMRIQRTRDDVSFSKAIEARVALQDGEPSATRVEFPNAKMASAAVKKVAKELGADLVGVTHVDQHHVYKGEDVPHQYAIVIGIAMDYEEILRAPRAETNAEYKRVYDAVSAVAVDLAKHVRGRGYPARAHTFRKEQLSMLPHAHAAGLGELGKHGSLINRDLGCCFRVSAVTTDLPLEEDSPRLEGVDEICSNCNMCVNYCPGDAISHEKDDVRGVFKWVVDTEKCVPYFASHAACAICLQVCPFNAKAFDGWFMKSFQKTIKELDAEEMRARLTRDLQEQWSLISQPVGRDGI